MRMDRLLSCLDRALMISGILMVATEPEAARRRCLRPSLRAATRLLSELDRSRTWWASCWLLMFWSIVAASGGVYIFVENDGSAIEMRLWI